MTAPTDPPGLDAAIEAAAPVVCWDWSSVGHWDEASDARRDIYRRSARAILIAAAPALRAGALREAADVVRSLRLLVQLHDGPRDQHYEITKPGAWVEARAALAQWDVLRAGALRGLADVLAKHYLAEIVCDHERGEDNPRCACSLVHLGWYPSVGQAVDGWIDHVMAMLREQADQIGGAT